MRNFEIINKYIFKVFYLMQGMLKNNLFDVRNALALEPHFSENVRIPEHPKNSMNKHHSGRNKRESFFYFTNYELFILIGILMTAGTLIKLLGIKDFSSDWFWLLAGVGLVVEGSISLVKQKRFDKKYKIIEVD